MATQTSGKVNLKWFIDLNSKAKVKPSAKQ
jgi:hypothetical protein